MTISIETEAFDELKQLIEGQLVAQHGPMLSGEALSRALGYGSYDAFRQAVVRKTVSVPVFTIENRRGKFALSCDIASWIARQRLTAVINPQVDEEVSMQR